MDLLLTTLRLSASSLPPNYSLRSELQIHVSRYRNDVPIFLGSTPSLVVVLTDIDQIR